MKKSNEMMNLNMTVEEKKEEKKKRRKDEKKKERIKNGANLANIER